MGILTPNQKIHVNVTTWVLIGTLTFLISWDMYAKIKWGYDGTISRDILDTSTKNPILAFSAGVIAGHLFWAQTAPKS